MFLNSLTNNPHLEEPHRSVIDGVLRLTSASTTLTLERANILDMDPADYQELIDGFLSLSEIEQNRVIQNIILGYTAAHTRREAIERMKQLPTSSNSGK